MNGLGGDLVQGDGGGHQWMQVISFAPGSYSYSLEPQVVSGVVLLAWTAGEKSWSKCGAASRRISDAVSMK